MNKRILQVGVILSLLHLPSQLPAQERNQPPKPLFDPASYGAKGDGVSYDTVAIQKAIDACAGTKGSVVLKPGRYVSAQLTLREGMTFHLDKGAVLQGGTNAVDYPVLLPPENRSSPNTRSLIYANKADNLTIEGPGEIDGRCRLVGMSGKEPERPSLIRIFNSTNVVVRDVTLRNPKMWTQVYWGITGLVLDHVTVDAPPICPNLDGMDICDSTNVVVRNCLVRSEDDSICLKCGKPGLSNITVENNRIHSYGANAIKLGTASGGPVTHLVITNNVIDYAKFGGLCIESVDGAAVRDVTVRDLRMSHVAQPVFIRLANRGPDPKTLASKPGKHRATHEPGSIDGVLIEELHAVSGHARTAPSCSITGIPGARVRNVTLRNCSFEMPGGQTKGAIPPEQEWGYPQSSIVGNTPAYGLFVRHADGIILENVTFGFLKADSRPWIFTSDSTVSTNGCKSIGLVTAPKK